LNFSIYKVEGQEEMGQVSRSHLATHAQTIEIDPTFMHIHKQFALMHTKCPLIKSQNNNMYIDADFS